MKTSIAKSNRIKKRIAIVFLVCLLAASTSHLCFAQYTKLFEFPESNYSHHSIISEGGFLLGVTSEGGSNNLGTIFKMKADGTGYLKLLDFAEKSNGTEPICFFHSDGTFLYGMTQSGGTNNLGVIFKIMQDGTNYTKVFDYTLETQGGSFFFDGFLYGTTSQGGANNKGTIFKMRLDGTGYSKLLDFEGDTSPIGSLISDGTFLFGMTYAYYTGTTDRGTIFKIMPDGTGFTKLLDFADVNDTPQGPLFYDGTFLYGFAIDGTTYKELIFKIKTDGTGYSILFPGDVELGYPLGSNIFDGEFLYGITIGGRTFKGTIFKIRPDGTGYSTLQGFVSYNGIDGANPNSLITDGTDLYGTTSHDSPTGNGTVFKIKPDGTEFVTLLDFDSNAPLGRLPKGALYSDGTYLYGMTLQGGPKNLGTIFKIMPDGTGFSKLLDFNGETNGSFPMGSLISDGTFLYGMTWQGGTNNMGTIFKIMTDGTGYAKLLDFTGAENGAYPESSLFFDGTFLYGMTVRGGTMDMGTMFKIMPDGTGYSKLLDFTGTANGSNPNGSFISDGTFLFGMTSEGGVNNMGTIFKIKPDGTGYSKLFDFAGGSYAGSPIGALIAVGEFLYGAATHSYGSYGDGVLFKIKSDGTGYKEIGIPWNPGYNGGGPTGSLVSDGISLYGTTLFGGKYTGGILFKINLDGTGSFRLYEFPYDAYPGSLISDGQYLFGMSSFPGGGGGEIFRYCLLEIPGPISGDRNFCPGSSYTFSIKDVSGATSYNWTLPGDWQGKSTTTSITATAGTQVGYVYVSANNSCGTTPQQTIFVDLIIHTPYIYPEAIYSGSILLGTIVGDSYSYQWFEGNNPVGNSQTLLVSSPGEYNVKVTVAGCTSNLSSPYYITTEDLSNITEVIESNKRELTIIYPNPGSDHILLSLGGFEEGKSVSISIVDMQGRIIENTTGLGQHEVSIDVRNYAAGKYIIWVQQDNKRASMPFIKADK